METNRECSGRLVDRIQQASRARGLRRQTAASYARWIARYIAFHGKHPALMGENDILGFLHSLETDAGVSASTRNQALTALLFLYQSVLGRQLDWQGRTLLARPSPAPTCTRRRQEVRTRLAGIIQSRLSLRP
jgi:hypothetical protein